MKVDQRKGPQAPSVAGPGPILPADTAGPSAPPSDQVSVSDTARRLAQLRADLGDVTAADPARQQKIEGLRAVMAKGQYSADLEDVARKLLREVLGDLLA